MLSSRATSALFDIRGNAPLAREWTAGHTLEAFRDDRQLFYAVTRCLEIVSEASRRLPSSLRERHSHLPWPDIRDAGNVYSHNYDNVAEAIVWRTALSSLFEYLCEKNAVTHNPVNGVRRPKAESGEGKTPALGDHQARDLLAAHGKDSEPGEEETHQGQAGPRHPAGAAVPRTAARRVVQAQG